MISNSKHISFTRGHYRAKATSCRCLPHHPSHPSAHQANALIENLLKAAESRWTVPGGINADEIKDELEHLKHAALSLPPGVAIDLSHNEGSFQGVLTTNNGFTADETTLGRLTFNLLSQQTVVSLSDPRGKSLRPMPSLFKGVFEGKQQSYILNTHFLLKPSDSVPLHGLMTMIAEYSVSPDPDPALSITFEKMRISPVDSMQLDAWLVFFKSAAEGKATVSISSDGVIEMPLPQKIKGEVKFILLTKEYQVHIGNGGGHYVMNRIS